MNQSTPKTGFRFSIYGTGAAAFLTIFALLLANGRTDLLRDPGIFWHIVVGEQILSERALIYRDRFSFTFHGEPWIAQQWLAECLMALVHFLAGFTGLILTAATVGAAVFAWIALRMRRNGLHELPTLFFAMMGTAAVVGHLHPRPHLATMVILAVTVARLADYEQSRIGFAKLYWLVPLFVLWGNLHGGVLGGIATVWIVIVGWVVFWHVGLPSPISHWRETARHFGLAIALTMTVFVNPYGVKLPQTWLTLLGMDLTFMSEHAPLDWKTPIGQTTLVMAVIYLLLVIRIRPRSLQVCWLIPLPWFCLGVLHVRHAPLFSILVLITIASSLPQSGWAEWFKSRGWFQSSALSDSPSRGPLWAVAGVVVLLALAATFWRFAFRTELWAKPDKSVWPSEVLTGLQTFAKDHSDGTRIFNEMAYGGFLIYNTPTLRVFVDDRCELYGEAFMRKCLSAYRDPKKVNEWTEIYDIRAALVTENSSFDQFLKRSEEWDPVSSGSGAVFYVKR